MEPRPRPRPSDERAGHPHGGEPGAVTEMLGLLHVEVEVTLAGPGRQGDGFQSRNVSRKRRHWEKRLAAKKNKRKEEKRRRKLSSREQEADDSAGGDGPHFTKRVLRAITRERLAQAQSTGAKLCVDPSMTERMSDKEIGRLAGQLRRLHGCNRKASRPFHLFLGDLREDSRLHRGCLRMNDGFLHYTMDVTERSCLDLFPPEQIIYLSPDAERALESVDADKVYILGGLVDESIQKKVSYLRAGELGVQTARLPIDEHMAKTANAKNFHSKILAINQVLDILLTFCDTGSWSSALEAAFPRGKGYVVAPAPGPWK